MRRAGFTLCLCAFLMACGGPAATPTQRPVATQTRAAAVSPSARPSAPAPTAAPTAAPSAAPSAAVSAPSAYSGARWHSIPTPGAILPHQEATNRYAIFVTGTQQSVIKLYDDAYRADGWVEAVRTTANGSAFFTYQKGGQRFVVAFGPDLGTNSVVVVIDDAL